MQVENTAIRDVKVLAPERKQDERGFFSEVYSRRAMEEAGIVTREFVQHNHSLSRQVGVVRGLHYQLPPSAQDKLVRVVRGRILDVAVDVRRSSPTFGTVVAHELSADNGKQMFVPVGCAHGFATLEPDTEVIYLVTAFYDAARDRGVRWNDPALGIDWGVDESRAVLSDRDRKHPLLSDAAADPGQLFE